MRRCPLLEDEDQFMLGAVECHHSRVGLVPDAKVFQFGKDDFARGQKFLRVPPVHADEGDCSVSAPLGGWAEGLFQKGRELS